MKDAEDLFGVDERRKNKAGIETGWRKLGSYGVTWWREIGLGSADIYSVRE